MKLDDIETAAIVAKLSKWKVQLDPQDVLLMTLYIRQAEVALSGKHATLVATVTADLRATARDLGLSEKRTVIKEKAPK